MHDLRAKYTKIWDENAETLRKYCRSKLQKYNNETEDIITEVFTLLWEKIKTDGVPAEPKAWIYAILSLGVRTSTL
ncbi:MAG: hypothetical protein IJA02_08990 [Clostridia bacterium]|nr:hypothetical protein [Clostridia bacterium]